MLSRKQRAHNRSKKFAVGFMLMVFSVGLLSSSDVPVYAASIPTIHSDSYPNEDEWYNTMEAFFSWDIPTSVVAVRTLYDNIQNSLPSKEYDPPIASKSFTLDGDGVYYMHVEFKDGNEWGDVAHRKFQVDTHPPRILSMSVAQGTTTTDVTPTLFIDADDALSGVARVTISIDGGTPVEYPVSTSNTYTLTELAPGKHIFTITVFDKANNKTEDSLELTVTKLDTPAVINYTRRVDSGGKPTIFGRTYPNKAVEITLTDDNRHIFLETTRANSKGEFTYMWPQKLGSGAYDMSVRVIDDNGAASNYSEPRTIVVEDAKLLHIGMFIMNWLSLMIIAILSGALIVSTLWYAIVQFGRFRRKVNRTMKEAEQMLKVNVAALRRDTEEFHTLLVKAEKKRELTKEEQSILKKFKKRLDVTEKEIEKKLERIG